MTNKLIIRELTKLFLNDDILITSNKYIYEEVINNNRAIIEVNTSYLAPYIALGLSSGVNKRVFILCFEHDVQNNMNFMLQLAASKKSNIFVLVLRTKVFGEKYKTQSLLESSRSLLGVFHNMGINAFDFSPYFTKLENVSKIKGHMRQLVGPALVFLDASPFDGMTLNCKNFNMINING